MATKTKAQLQKELTDAGIEFSPTAKMAELVALAESIDKDLDEMEQITVTQEYLDAHPEAVDQGIEVGDEIEVPKTPAPVGEEKDQVKGGTVPTLKKGEGYSILKNGEYVRTYDNKEDAQTFCTKNAVLGAIAVAESSIVGITVEYEGRTPEGTLENLSKSFTNEDDSDFKAEAMIFKNSVKNGFAKAVLEE